MTGLRLTGLQVENFRSISGRIAVSLDADIILIHGPNGSGKTSIISAIELALTGGISGLERVAPDYQRHLLHAGASSGAVELSYSGGHGSQTRKFEISASGAVGEPVLAGDQLQFLTERAYLAQSSLGRLIDLYDESDRKGDSALTRFVNELLGLDSLDHLIDGLDPALDIRRVRKLIPEFLDAERGIAHSNTRIHEIQAELTEVSAQREEAFSALRELPDEWATDAQLARVANLQSALSRLRRIGEEVASAFAGDASDMELGDLDIAAIRNAVSDWSARISPAVSAVFTEAEELLPDLPKLDASPTSVSSSAALLRERLAAISSETAASLAASGRFATRRDELVRASADLQIQVSRVETQIAAIAEGGQLGELAALLAELADHVHDETCPVCGRDFGEVSPTPLREALHSRVEMFGNLAEQIAELSARRNSLSVVLTETDSELQIVSARVFPADEQLAAEKRAVQVNSLLAQLSSLSSEVSRIDQLITRERDLQLATSQRDSASFLLQSLRRDAFEIASSVLGEIPDRSGDLQDVVVALVARVEELIGTEASVLGAARMRADLEMLLNGLMSRHSGLTRQMKDLIAEQRIAKRQIAEVKRRVQRAKVLSNAAVDARARIVSSVFDESLNRVWRDLFTRLAPLEPYVPEFMSGTKRGEPVRVRVRHGAEVSAGAPGVVLSAGNLNTAALTLFLSLNHSAGPKVPFLLLDDPVQAMDDIHVAQFAALLRSYARDLKRQIVVSVHERALYEYLVLELAPSAPPERLARVELSRSASAQTFWTTEVDKWRPDPVVMHDYVA